ncbi:hypothetical protein Pfo_022477 [Paulownia fortunei]|nr:hypothetical protein Pfo_022477 [Paulownia fortunei]
MSNTLGSPPKHNRRSSNHGIRGQDTVEEAGSGSPVTNFSQTPLLCRRQTFLASYSIVGNNPARLGVLQYLTLASRIRGPCDDPTQGELKKLKEENKKLSEDNKQLTFDYKILMENYEHV